MTKEILICLLIIFDCIFYKQLDKMQIKIFGKTRGPRLKNVKLDNILEQIFRIVLLVIATFALVQLL